MDATTNADTDMLVDSLDQRPRLPRKIHLDTSIYCQHSARASGGSEDCDHDFNDLPDLVEGACATWICLRCGRRVRYEEWK
jgi:hypothetical protein